MKLSVDFYFLFCASVGSRFAFLMCTLNFKSVCCFFFLILRVVNV